jgi:hypothetical protein
MSEGGSAAPAGRTTACIDPSLELIDAPTRGAFDGRAAVRDVGCRAPTLEACIRGAGDRDGSGPVTSASLDEATFSVRIEFPRGELRVHPEGTTYRRDEIASWRRGDQWELSADAFRVYPDLDEGTLLVTRS